MKVPFVDLGTQHESLQPALDEALRRVLRGGHFILGPEVEAFEREFARFCGTEYGVGTGNGLDALRVALLACGVGAGDEVIVPAHTFIATAYAVSSIGAVPVLAEVRREDFLLDVEAAGRAVTRRTRAIVPVHLYGQPADMDAVLVLARAKGLKVVEDACQAHGATWKGRPVGSLGDAGCFSFYPAKNLGAVGDGGAIVTGDAAIADAARRIRNVGQQAKYVHTHAGLNSRLDELQAAVLRIKLPQLPRWNAARQAAAAVYAECLPRDGMEPPRVMPDRTHVFHLYVVRTRERAAAISHCKANGVDTGIHYPGPIHLQEAYRERGWKRGDFPVSEELADTVLSLPMFETLDAARVRRVGEVLAGCAERR